MGCRTKIVIGNKYGMLTPVRLVGRNKFKLLVFECICDCGNVVNVNSRDMTDGRVKSCGCLRSKSLHRSNDITYKSWMGAKQRCYNPNNQNFKHYGGRGIKMNELWKNSFVAFLHDMGTRPSKEYTLDRIDVNGDYCLENCRWADKKTQNNNRRNNHFVKFRGVIMTLSEFSEKFKLNHSNVCYEISKGLTLEQIVKKYKNKDNLKAIRAEASRRNLSHVRHKRNGELLFDKTERGGNGYGSSDK